MIIYFFLTRLPLECLRSSDHPSHIFFKQSLMHPRSACILLQWRMTLRFWSPWLYLPRACATMPCWCPAEETNSRVWHSPATELSKPSAQFFATLTFKKKNKRKSLCLKPKKNNPMSLKSSHFVGLLCRTGSAKLCTPAATLPTDVSDTVIKWEAIWFNNNKKATSSPGCLATSHEWTPQRIKALNECTVCASFKDSKRCQ